MLPVGLLMIEHRLIERMIALLRKELDKIKKEGKADTAFIDKALDFIHVYADRCHHGKEEDILFKGLSKKDLSVLHKRVLDELIAEHGFARRMTKDLLVSKEAYAKGHPDALSGIAKAMRELAVLYPKHIEKEDKHFFLPIMDYFSKEEQLVLLHAFREFDKEHIQEKYESFMDSMERD